MESLKTGQILRREARSYHPPGRGHDTVVRPGGWPPARPNGLETPAPWVAVGPLPNVHSQHTASAILATSIGRANGMRMGPRSRGPDAFTETL